MQTSLISTLPRLIKPCPQACRTLPLHGVQATRRLEQEAASSLPPHALMQRAGLAVARVSLAIAPHAQTVWVACGYGNNGGDGLQAAACLQAWGKQVKVSALAQQTAMPADAQAAWQEAIAAGVCFVDEPPMLQEGDLCIDALLGIGLGGSSGVGNANRPPDQAMQRCMAAMRRSPAQVLAVDMPSGLLADSGAWAGDAPGVCAHHTVALLTLKPGMFTAHGRDACGQIWWHDLGVPATAQAPDTWLQGATLDDMGSVSSSTRKACTQQHPAFARQAPAWQPHAQGLPAMRSTQAHASHKGSFGDVCIIGGDAGMQGAAILAGEAALYGGAGRVHVGLLQASPSFAAHDASLMLHQKVEHVLGQTCQQAVTVCGCGGGQAIAHCLPDVLQRAPRLILDADALNAIAASAKLQALLRQRANQNAQTLITPHPLEAARLLQQTTAAVEHDRLGAARALAQAFQCAVVLKGSGSVCAVPAALLDPSGCHADARTMINHSGNALLATAGTGDVLAGCAGAYWAQAHAYCRAYALPGTPQAAWLAAWRACCAAVHAHGHVADEWNACTMRGALSAQRLAQSLRRPASKIWADYGPTGASMVDA